MTASVIVSLDMEDPAVAHVKMVTGEHRWTTANVSHVEW